MIGLYKYSEYFGRMGALEGLFFASADEIAQYRNTEIHFGEVLGKHSDIVGEMNDETLQLITDDPDVVALLRPFGISTGVNPFDYIAEDI